MKNPRRQADRDDVLVVDEDEKALSHLRNHLGRSGQLSQTGFSAGPPRARRLSSAVWTLPLRYRS